MKPSFATVQEAKDFLVGRVAAEAAIEGISFNDDERKLMYYSVDDASSQDSAQDPTDDPQFEEKISGLIRRASERDTEKRTYKAAFKKLAQGDHYLRVMDPFAPIQGGYSTTEPMSPPLPGGIYIPGVSPLSRGWGRSTPLRDSGKLFLTALAVVAGMFLFMAYWQPAKEAFWHWLHRMGR